MWRAPMLPLSYAWLLWFASMVLIEASPGDRDVLYTSCLDRCVDKLCGIQYFREESILPLTLQRYQQQQELQEQLDEHLFQLQQQRQQWQQQQQERQRQEQQQQEQRRLLKQEQEGEGGEVDSETRKMEGAPTDINNNNNNNNNNIDNNIGDNVQRQRQRRRRLTKEADVPGGQRAEPALPYAGNGDGSFAAKSGGGEGRGGSVVDRYAHSPPWHLRAMGWDCVSECGYQCMTMHVELRIRAGEPVQQYHGKWPFRRVWGIQELFASLFSAGNGLPHLYHVVFSAGLYNPPGNYMRLWLSLYPWVGMNTWLWSTVFHARDVRWTEAADYFFALLNIFYVVWVAIVKVAGPPQTRRPSVRKMVPLAGVSMSVYYVLHISFMWFVKFDYGYNMKVALVAGLVHTGLWLRYQYRIRDRDYARRGALSIVLLNAAILLEVGDFPPVFYRLVDAHAIWHMVTVPLMFMWYRFIIEDARHEVLLAAAKDT
eukprot:jgi/Undpi1/10800/HiC_scaffold_3.g01329.m1